MRRLVLTKRTLGRPVTLKDLVATLYQDAKDRFGCTLAYVNVVGGPDVGRSMVTTGWATVYVFAAPFARLATFTSAENAAQAAPRGAWSACGGNFHRIGA